MTPSEKTRYRPKPNLWWKWRVWRRNRCRFTVNGVPLHPRGHAQIPPVALFHYDNCPSELGCICRWYQTVEKDGGERG